MYNKSSFDSTFLPAETSLLSSIQRAKQRIFSKSSRTESQSSKNYNNPSNQNRQNDQNNSLNSNLQHQASVKMLDKVIEKKRYMIGQLQKQPNQLRNTRYQQQQQKPRQKSTSHVQQPSTVPNQSNNVVVNAIKLLQQKIQQLQTKNKHLEQKLQQNSTNVTHRQPANDTKSLNITKQGNQDQSAIQKQQSDFKSYLLLKQQCQSLQKQNASLCQELSKRKENTIENIKYYKKESGRKLDFHHEVSQNISNVFQMNNNQQKYKQLEERLNKKQQELNHYRALFENQKKKNFAILKLHQEEIIKNEELLLELNQSTIKMKQLQEQSGFRQRKSASNQRSNPIIHVQNLQSQSNAKIKQSVVRQKNIELQKTIQALKQELQTQKLVSEQKSKQITQIQRRYIQVKESFIELYKDLSRYHPEVLNSNIKFIYERIRKGEDIMLKSRSILSHRFGKLSQTKNSNRLSQFRSKSGKKGLKMEDLNSSKRSHSRDRSNSEKNNNSTSKSNYRSPYGQQNLTKRNKIKAVLSPEQQQRHRSTTGQQQNSKAKLSQIQKIIKQIKQLSKQIKSIKTEHRNLSVKLGISEGQQKSNGSNVQNQKNQERMNELIEMYNEKNAKLQQLKQEKDRLALETVPDMLL